MQRVLRFFKRTVIFLLVVAGLIGAASYVIAHFYEDEVKQLVINRVNTRLATEINVADVSLTLIPKFPYASLDFEDIWARENIVKIGETDTLFYFRHAYLQFNVMELIKGEYNLRKIALEDGFARLYVDEEGYDNYQIFKPQSDTSETAFLLSLEDVTLAEVDFSFLNKIKQDEILLYGEDVTMSGEFSRDLFTMDLAGNVRATSIVLNKTTYMAGRKLELNTRLDIDKPARKYTIGQGLLRVDGQMNFKLAGDIINNPEAVALNLQINSSNLDIPSGVELLPNEYRKQLARYDSDGILDFSCAIAGEVGKRATPLVSATFGVENGTLSANDSEHVLEQVHMKGSYSNGKKRNTSTSTFDMAEFSAKLGNGTIRSTLHWYDFNQPNISLSAEADMDMAQWLDFFPSDTIEAASGRLRILANWEGKIDDLDSLKAVDLIHAKTSGAATVEGISIAIKDQPLQFTNLTGDLTFHDNNVVVERLSGNVSSSDFKMEGLFKNMLPWLLMENEPLTVEAKLFSDNLDLDELLLAGGEETNSDEAMALKFPEKLRFNLKLDVGHLAFRRFKADKLRGVARLDGHSFSAAPLSFESMQGKTLGSCRIDDMGGMLAIRSNITAKGVDLQELFYTFEDFTQDVVQEKHLRGRTDCELAFRANMSPELILDESSIVSEATLSVKDGELVEFQPLIDIAEYMRTNKLLNTFLNIDALEAKMEHVHFTELSNNIRVKDKKVTIPEMAIVSNAMRLDLEGTHTFDNQVDYRFEFALADVLKKKNVQSDLTELPEDSKGRARITIWMTGTVDEPVFEYKASQLFAGVKQKLHEEKQTVKSILHEEYGIFGKDTTLRPVDDGTPKPTFDIVWDDEPELNSGQNVPENQTAEKKPEPKEKNNFKSVLKRVAQPEQETTTDEFDFGEDDF